MSPASYLTAPPRVAAVDCTTVRISTIHGVFWLALAFCLVAVLGSIGYAATRALAPLADGSRDDEGREPTRSDA